MCLFYNNGITNLVQWCKLVSGGKYLFPSARNLYDHLHEELFWCPGLWQTICVSCTCSRPFLLPGIDCKKRWFLLPRCSIAVGDNYNKDDAGVRCLISHKHQTRTAASCTDALCILQVLRGGSGILQEAGMTRSLGLQNQWGIPPKGCKSENWSPIENCYNRNTSSVTANIATKILLRFLSRVFAHISVKILTVL